MIASTSIHVVEAFGILRNCCSHSTKRAIYRPISQSVTILDRCKTAVFVKKAKRYGQKLKWLFRSPYTVVHWPNVSIFMPPVHKWSHDRQPQQKQQPYSRTARVSMCQTHQNRQSIIRSFIHSRQCHSGQRCTVQENTMHQLCHCCDRNLKSVQQTNKNTQSLARPITVIKLVRRARTV